MILPVQICSAAKIKEIRQYAILGHKILTPFNFSVNHLFLGKY
jgi:hypothetical protein